MASRSACRSSRDTRARPLAGWPARYRPPAPPAARPAPRPLPPLARQRGVDKAVLDREVPLDRQFLWRDQFDHLGDLGAECGGDAGCHLRVVGGVLGDDLGARVGRFLLGLVERKLARIVRVVLGRGVATQDGGDGTFGRILGVIT